jgi:hypothetical protein
VHDLVIRGGTVVDGETVVDHGELTDARPGALVRGPQS